MDVATIVGTVAAVCSVTSFVPQAWRIVRTRDVAAISAPMYAMTVIGFALWVGYGVLVMAWPLIIPNSICLCLSAFILIMRVLPRHKRDAVADTVQCAINPSA